MLYVFDFSVCKRFSLIFCSYLLQFKINLIPFVHHILGCTIMSVVEEMQSIVMYRNRVQLTMYFRSRPIPG
jgi:hypothetical protein